MKVIYLDCQNVRSREDLFRLLQETLPMPEDLHNLDALHDFLTEYGEDWDIIVYDTEPAGKALGQYYDRFCRACEDAAAQTPGLQVRFYP